MVVYFLTKQEDVLEAIASRLKASGHCASVFTDPAEFYGVVKTQGNEKIDLLAIDYSFVEHEYFSPFDLMVKQKCIIPLIYYNDPYPEPFERAVYWKVKNKNYLMSLIPEEKIENLHELLFQLETLVDSEEFNPYLKIINRPKKFSERLAVQEKEKNVINLEEFRQKNRIQPSRFKLFKYLYENKSRMFSKEELCIYLWNEFSDSKIKTLYTYIHELREACRNEHKVCMTIVKEGKGMYGLTVNRLNNKGPLDFTSVKEFFEDFQNAKTNILPVKSLYHLVAKKRSCLFV